MRLVLCLLLLIPLAGAQPWLEDASGDVQYLLAEDQALAGGDHGPADLVGLYIEEIEELFIFGVEVADLEPTTPGSWPDAARLDVRFRHGAQFYDVGTGIGQTGAPFAELRIREAGSQERLVQALNFTQDGARFDVEVPRDLLRDENGAPPVKGRFLEDLHMGAHVHATGVFLTTPDGDLMQPLGIRDRAPDEGVVRYAIQLGGPETQGFVDVVSALPFRASNGGGGTFLFEAEVRNTGQQTETFQVMTEGAPSLWNLSHVPELVLEPGALETFWVAVKTPFGHQHGGIDAFTVHLMGEASHASWDFGILYLETPQPAGHHNRVYLHSQPIGTPPGSTFQGDPSGILWMNTLEEDEADMQVPVEGVVAAPGDNVVRWTVCLDPALRLGLDVDAAKEGLFDGAFTASGGGTGTLRGELLHLAPGTPFLCAPGRGEDRTETLLASFETSATLDGSSVTAPMIAQDVGKIPFKAGGALVMRLELELPGPVLDLPDLLPGAELRVPLRDYHDEPPKLPAEASFEETAEASPQEESPGPWLLAPLLVALALRRLPSKP